MNTINTAADVNCFTTRKLGETPQRTRLDSACRRHAGISLPAVSSTRTILQRVPDHPRARLNQYQRIDLALTLDRSSHSNREIVSVRRRRHGSTALVMPVRLADGRNRNLPSKRDGAYETFSKARRHVLHLSARQLRLRPGPVA